MVMWWWMKDILFDRLSRHGLGIEEIIIVRLEILPRESAEERSARIEGEQQKKEDKCENCDAITGEGIEVS